MSHTQLRLTDCIVLPNKQDEEESVKPTTRFPRWSRMLEKAGGLKLSRVTNTTPGSATRSNVVPHTLSDQSGCRTVTANT